MQQNQSALEVLELIISKYNRATFTTPYGEATVAGYFPGKPEADFEVIKTGEIVQAYLSDVKPYLRNLNTLSPRERMQMQRISSVDLRNESEITLVVLQESFELVGIEKATKAQDWLRKNCYDIDRLIDTGRAFDVVAGRDLIERPLYADRDRQRELYNEYPNISANVFKVLIKAGWISCAERIEELLPEDQEVTLENLLAALGRVKAEFEYFFDVDGLRGTKAA